MGRPYIREIVVVGNIPSLGDIILFDDFEDLFKWSGTGTGTDWLVEKNTATAFNKSASLHIKTKATTPAAGDYVTAYRYIYLPPPLKLSLECFWYYVSDTLVDFFAIELIFQDGSYRTHGKVRFHPPESKWQYRDDTPAYVDIPGGSQKLNEGAWHRVALKLNFKDKIYSHLKSDDLEIDLSALKMQSVSDTTAKQLYVAVSVSAETNARAECYIDDLLIREI